MSVKSRDHPGVFPTRDQNGERNDKDSIGRNRHRVLYHVVINGTHIGGSSCTGTVITKEQVSTSNNSPLRVMGLIPQI